MALGPGTRLGAYEILTLLGSGGMGEVYRARDTKLNRDVAIKVLPDLFASDPERLKQSTPCDEQIGCTLTSERTSGAQRAIRYEPAPGSSSLMNANDSSNASL
jgi:serine/threonine protein kinase